MDTQQSQQGSTVDPQRSADAAMLLEISRSHSSYKPLSSDGQELGDWLSAADGIIIHAGHLNLLSKDIADEQLEPCEVSFGVVKLYTWCKFIQFPSLGC